MPYEFPAMNATRAERDAIDAASGARDKRSYVRTMFSEIAPRYDLLNHLLSFNIDRVWRRKAIAALAGEQTPDGLFLDVCAGTLDVAIALARRRGFRGHVIGADFAEGMLKAGQAKTGRSAVFPLTADALSLPLASASVDGAIVAFGVRNFADLDAGLREIARVLRSGGRFVILEFTTPPSALIRALYGFYSNRVLPLVGGLISGSRGAYRYLPESIARFPAAPELGERLRSAGFDNVSWELLTFGTVAIHRATRV